ncbi:MAG TPA: hypothetical protein VMT11_17395 [Myxococcaceae bacterium]|nr:hypothetical protein [Myxococcaceae bacterium]
MFGIDRSRKSLPLPGDRLLLGPAGLQVSPFCLGLVRDPRTVLDAFDAGINFFFLSLDLHWPLYEGTRRGLAALLARNSIRDRIVVGVVSYLDQPLFHNFQAQELIDSVEGLGRTDLLIAGAVSNHLGFGPRIHSLAVLRSFGHAGATAIGATFHERLYALQAVQSGTVDIAFCRYNSAHSRARADLFPYLPSPRRTLVYGFNSVSSLPSLPVSHGRSPEWVPAISDHYRFALTRPELDGILCAPKTPGELRELIDALGKGPLRPQEEDVMISLSGATPYGYAQAPSSVSSEVKRSGRARRR